MRPRLRPAKEPQKKATGVVAAGVLRRRKGNPAWLVGQAGSGALRRWQQLGQSMRAEAFADRRYERDGTPRALHDALLTDAGEVAAQAVRLARGEGALAADGTVVPVVADTICLHGDTPGAVALARAVRRALADAGIAVRA